MCTISIIPVRDDGFRLVASRDELRSRPTAQPPQCVTLSRSRAAIWPTDPTSGGTWIAASDNALVLAILNLNLDPSPPEPDPRRSRGGIIPAIIESYDAARAAACLHDMDLAPYAPFRLLAVDPVRVVVARWDGADLAVESGPFAPTCLVSSGLGDHLVHQPRLDLWNEMVIKAGTSPATQDAFHAHAWPDRPHLSVNMSRDDARTVSRTTVRVRHDTVEMRYHTDDAPTATVTVPRVPLEDAPSLPGSPA